ncbi:hypothetical protein BGZ94_001038 [Podila epigama]|nr:hypothetical protein BGZ94_001038 [Podila epigama]
MASPPSFSPVTQVDPTSLTTSAAAASAAEEKVSADQFNTLHASSVTYRDLLIFEERLKLNMVRLKQRQQKYEGMYSEKLGNSSKFVPQCNRVLRIFNMHFNRDNRPELSFFRKVPKKFQEGFSEYKASYFKRKSERRAAALAAAKAGGHASGSDDYNLQVEVGESPEMPLGVIEVEVQAQPQVRIQDRLGLRVLLLEGTRLRYQEARTDH